MIKLIRIIFVFSQKNILDPSDLSYKMKASLIGVLFFLV